MSEWKDYKFGELLLEPVRNGIYKEKAYHGKGVKIVNMGELFRYPRLTDVEMKRVEINENEKSKCLLKNGDLIFARRSLTAEGAGKCSLVYKVSEDTTFESSIIRARVNQNIASPEFLYYYFNSSYGKYLLGTILRQVAVSGITGKDLVELTLNIPTHKSQIQIASFLIDLDDKIDLLRQQNTTLELLSEKIFNQLFIKGGNTEMVQLKSLVDVVDNRGKTPQYSHVKTDYPIIEVKSLSSPDRFVDYEACEKFINKDLFESWFRAGHPLINDILFSTVGSIGEMAIVIENKGAIAQNVIAMRTKELSPFYLYQYLSLPTTRESLMNLDIGAVQPSIKVPHLMDIEIPIPKDKKLVSEFERELMPLFEKMKINHNPRIVIRKSSNGGH